MNKTRETLESARRIIDNSENWCQGTLEDRKGRVCSVGAIDKATILQGNYGARMDAVKALSEVVPAVIWEERPDWMTDPEIANKPQNRVAAYNDTHDHECVLAAFDSAIERLKDD